MSHLVKVYDHTFNYCIKNKRKFKRPVTVKYSGIIKEFTPPRPFGNTKAEIQVVEKDTIVAALDLQDEKLNPLVLNMASERVPGGGVRKGSKAQEESLFRRTNYFMHLNKKVVKYPLGEIEAVYTPNVAVIKNTEYKLLESPIHMSFIACPGIRYPEFQANGRMTSFNRYLLKQKIRMIFQVAAYHKHDSIVLGALGCGAFNCVPEHVVEEFNKITQEFQPGTFKKIVYAINSQGRDSNFTIFNKKIDRN